MHDQLAMRLQDDLTTMIVETGARGVLIDISVATGRRLVHRAHARHASPRWLGVLDAETVVVGMQPAVAITLVELGLTLPGVRTALNVDRGMELLEEELRTAS